MGLPKRSVTTVSFVKFPQIWRPTCQVLSAYLESVPWHTARRPVVFLLAAESSKTHIVGFFAYLGRLADFLANNLPLVVFVIFDGIQQGLALVGTGC